MIVGDDRPLVQLTAEEEASLADSLAQAARRKFATDEQVQAVWAQHGLRDLAMSARAPLTKQG